MTPKGEKVVNVRLPPGLAEQVDLARSHFRVKPPRGVEHKVSRAAFLRLAAAHFATYTKRMTGALLGSPTPLHIDESIIDLAKVPNLEGD